MLPVQRDHVPTVVADELTRLHPARIVVVGGTAVISAAVERALTAYAGHVSRVAGPDRFATAVALTQLRWDEPPTDATIYVASGTSFADALMAGPLVASMANAAMLPVAADWIPTVVADELTRLHPTRTVVVGGTAVVSDIVARQLAGPASTFALHRYRATMPGGWGPPIVLPYGPAESQLGTSPGGEGLEWGPDYGAVAPDGTWWILDSAKVRFAHFDASGRYLGQVVIPARYLVQGQYVQWQHPIALADGSIVTSRFAGDDTTALLRLHNGAFSQVTTNRLVIVEGDDGTLLYGFGPNNELLSVAPTTGAVTAVSAFRSRAGVRYRLSLQDETLRLVLPDQGIDHSWPVVAAETGGPAAGAISLATTADRRMHLIVDGAALADERTGRSGYGAVAEDGTLTPTEPTRDPWSPSDGGTGSRIVARPGGTQTWFVTIDTDAVRLYPRS